jgi:predicted dienelactone hydrolase
MRPADVADKMAEEDAPLHETDAYRDLPTNADARHPIVLFSHGLGGYRSQSSFLTAHLASWGFVVVAPEHPERGLAAVLSGQALADNSSTALLDALEMLKSEDTLQGGRFEGRLDFAHVAVSGHSMGGGATMVVAGPPSARTAASRRISRPRKAGLSSTTM